MEKIESLQAGIENQPLHFRTLTSGSSRRRHQGKIFRQVVFYAGLVLTGMRIRAEVPSSILSRRTVNP